jgi:hypothetical protein
MSSPAEGIAPERPDVASERAQPESESTPRDGPRVPDVGPTDQRGLEDVVARDHPLS